MKAFRQIVMLTQIVVSIAAPLLICILGSRWLMAHFDLGKWVMAAGVFLGVGGAVSGLVKTVKQMLREADDRNSTPPVSFNDHE